MSSKNKIILFCIFCILLISFDRATKEIAKDHLKGADSISYLNDTFRLVYAENTGAFLSFGADWPWALSFIAMTLLPLLLISGIFIYALKKSDELSFFRLLPFALIVAGGLGNIIDRIFLDRHVTDFMNMGIGTLRTGIFNFADVYVSTGLVTLVIFSLNGNKKETVQVSEAGNSEEPVN